MCDCHEFTFFRDMEEDGERYIEMACMDCEDFLIVPEDDVEHKGDGILVWKEQ